MGIQTGWKPKLQLFSSRALQPDIQTEFQLLQSGRAFAKIHLFPKCSSLSSSEGYFQNRVGSLKALKVWNSSHRLSSRLKKCTNPGKQCLCKILRFWCCQVLYYDNSHFPHVWTVWYISTGCFPGKIFGGAYLQRPFMGNPHTKCCFISKPETGLHEEKPKRKPKRSKETGVHHNGQIEPGVCLHHLGPLPKRPQEAAWGLPEEGSATCGLATSDKLIVPRCETTQLRKHFVAKTIPQWNKLPENSTSAATVQAFKSKLNVHPNTRP